MISTALFGGSFNPIHRGHVALAHHVLQSGWADEVWLMVSPQNPLKESGVLLPEAFRYELAQRAVSDVDGLQACDFEFGLPRPSYTWQTLEALGEKYPERRFRLMIGADNWNCFPHWARHEDLLRHYDILVYPRPGHELPSVGLPPRVHVIDAPLLDISSTDIRRAVLEGRPVDHLLPAKIATPEIISQLCSLLQK